MSRVRKDANSTSICENRRNGWALIVICVSVLMTAANATIVNLALPAIKTDLVFPEATLAWVINSYLTTYSGFLLLGGRLGDVFGQRRIFALGISLFTFASLGCGLATSQTELIAARCIQGVGGAIVAALAVALIITLFPDPRRRTRAVGIYAFVSASGGALGLLFGGMLTSALNWHWVFLANIPAGLTMSALCLVLLPRDSRSSAPRHLDVAGAVTVTSAVMLLVYAITESKRAGWYSAEILPALGGSLLLTAVFVGVQSRAKSPLFPLEMLRSRTVAAANTAGALLSAAMLAWSFVSALYLQRIASFNPLQVGLTLLPTNVAVAVVALLATPHLVARYGRRLPIVAGTLLVAAGLTLLAGAPAHPDWMLQVLPGMLLIGLGAGLASNPLLLSAVSEANSADSGAASGVFITMCTMGSVIGLSSLTHFAAGWTSTLEALGADPLTALHMGYRAAFLASATLAASGAFLSAVFLRFAENAGPIAADLSTSIERNRIDRSVRRSQ
jgi:EmrB/QacA subfamily drug resistance transporter